MNQSNSLSSEWSTNQTQKYIMPETNIWLNSYLSTANLTSSVRAVLEALKQTSTAGKILVRRWQFEIQAKLTEKLKFWYQRQEICPGWEGEKKDGQRRRLVRRSRCVRGFEWWFPWECSFRVEISDLQIIT